MESISEDSFGEQWTRYDIQDDAIGMGVFDDQAMSYSIDGVSHENFKGFGGNKQDLTNGFALSSLGLSFMETGYKGQAKLATKMKDMFTFTKLGNMAKFGGLSLNVVGTISTAYDGAEAIKSGEPSAMFESSIDTVMTGVGYAGPWGTGASSVWFLTKPLRKKWTNDVLLKHMEANNGIVYPSLLGM